MNILEVILLGITVLLALFFGGVVLTFFIILMVIAFLYWALGGVIKVTSSVGRVKTQRRYRWFKEIK